jgi:hypothetical protein
MDPVSGGQLWRNTITGEISLEDPKDRPKSVKEMSADELRAHKVRGRCLRRR